MLFPKRCYDSLIQVTTSILFEKIRIELNKK